MSEPNNPDFRSVAITTLNQWILALEARCRADQIGPDGDDVLNELRALLSPALVTGETIGERTVREWADLRQINTDGGTHGGDLVNKEDFDSLAARIDKALAGKDARIKQMGSDQLRFMDKVLEARATIATLEKEQARLHGIITILEKDNARLRGVEKAAKDVARWWEQDIEVDRVSVYAAELITALSQPPPTDTPAPAVCVKCGSSAWEDYSRDNRRETLCADCGADWPPTPAPASKSLIDAVRELQADYQAWIDAGCFYKTDQQLRLKDRVATLAKFDLTAEQSREDAAARVVEAASALHDNDPNDVEDMPLWNAMSATVVALRAALKAKEGGE